MEVIRRDLLFEIGTEEIPARFIDKAREDLLAAGRKALEDARLTFSGVKVYTTPRRIALYVDGLGEYQEDMDRRVKGPSAKAAFDQAGKPTKACEGFARSQGVDLSSLQRVTDAAGDYIYAYVHEQGKRVNEVMPAICDGLIRSLAFPKNMRWGSSDFRFVRPIRWIVLLWGKEPIHMEFEGIDAGALSHGHRTLGPSGPVSIKNAENYLDAMRSAGVIADQAERACLISAQVASVADGLGCEAVMDESLLAEINNIVEWPTAFSGSFDPRFLEIPEICVTTPMEGHQRYFPVKKAGRLHNAFIAVRNGGTAGLDNVRHGNEKVLSGRLSDAKFFFEEDMRKSLEGRLDRLSGIAFAEGLGTMRDKTERIACLSERIMKAGFAGGDATESDISAVKRAGMLSKCDLATNMVREFTELQGHIGEIYAKLGGERADVAAAIKEHYMPTGAGAELPETRIGAVLAMADKADSLAGYFCLGQVPTGSADPYALRRSMLGLISIHEQWRPAIGIMEMLEMAIDGIWNENAPRPKSEVMNDLEDFAAGRLKGMLLEDGHRYDLVEAAMALGINKPYSVIVSLSAIEKDLSEGWMDELAVAFVRVRNIARNADSADFETAILKEDEEKRLAESYMDAAVDIEGILAEGESAESYAKAMSRFAALKPFIDAYFEKVMVMSEDLYIRKNRLGLIKSLENLALKLADFSKINQ